MAYGSQQADDAEPAHAESLALQRVTVMLDGVRGILENNSC